MCGPGKTCALVRQGHGPPVPDCLTFAEAQLLEQAFHGGPAGPGTGIGEMGVGFIAGGMSANSLIPGGSYGRQRSFLGARGGSLLNPAVGVVGGGMAMGGIGAGLGGIGTGIGGLPVVPVGLAPSVVVDPFLGMGGVGGFLDPTVGLGGVGGVVDPSFGVGVNPLVGANNRPNVGIVQPGGVGPAVVSDISRRTVLNINVSNTNKNQHNHSGGGGTQITGAGGVGPICTPCQPNCQCALNPACGHPTCI